MHVFEIIMLVCFGASWPAAIYKSLKSRSTGGKSLLFMVLILLGYLSGICFKVEMNASLGTDIDYVVFLYIFNALLVSADIALYFRNRAYERRGRPSYGPGAPGAD